MTSKRIVAFCLVLLLGGCPGTVSKLNIPGTTSGAITLSGGQVVSRERLLNDRNDQVAWLNNRLAATDQQAFGINGGIDFRTFSATLAQLQASNKVIRDRVSRPGTTDAGNGAGQNVEADLSLLDASGALKNDAASSRAPDPTAAKTFEGSSPIDDFRDRLSYREEVRSEIIETGLDDAHDLNGRALYRLQFSPTVLPEPDTGSWALIRMRILTDGQVLSKEKYDEWVRRINNQFASRLQNKVDDAIEERLSPDEFRLLKAQIEGIPTKCSPEKNEAFVSILEDKADFSGFYETEVGDLDRYMPNDYVVSRSKYSSLKSNFESIFDKCRPGNNYRSRPIAFEMARLQVNYYKRLFGTYLGKIDDKNINELCDERLRCSYSFKGSEDGRKELSKKLKGIEQEYSSDMGGAILVYAVTPKETVQRISDVAGRRESGQTALALNALLGSVGVDAGLTQINDSQLLLQALRRQPLVVGFSDQVQTAKRENVDLAAKESAVQKLVDELGDAAEEIQNKSVELLDIRSDDESGGSAGQSKSGTIGDSDTATEQDTKHQKARESFNKASKEFSDVQSALIEAQKELERERKNFLGVRKTYHEFGWIIGPQMKIDPGTARPIGERGIKYSFRHVNRQNSLAAVVGVPGWWTKLKLVAVTCWRKAQKDGIDDCDDVSTLMDRSILADKNAIKELKGNAFAPLVTKEIEIALPGAVDAITDALLPVSIKLRPEPKIEGVIADLRVGEDGYVLIPGTNLWRNAVVTIGSQAADKVTVLPDMEGIVAFFDGVRDQNGIVEGEGGRKVEVRVWTSAGNVSAGNVLISGYGAGQSTRVVALQNFGWVKGKLDLEVSPRLIRQSNLAPELAVRRLTDDGLGSWTKITGLQVNASEGLVRGVLQQCDECKSGGLIEVAFVVKERVGVPPSHHIAKGSLVFYKTEDEAKIRAMEDGEISSVIVSGVEDVDLLLPLSFEKAFPGFNPEGPVEVSLSADKTVRGSANIKECSSVGGAGKYSAHQKCTLSLTSELVQRLQAGLGGASSSQLEFMFTGAPVNVSVDGISIAPADRSKLGKLKKPQS
ncbi:hypothetical protein HED22_15335 [Thalassospira sp. HF15]|uniref:hypothetical protein n=1 Tax=Thalassospira sp. HF15 TaxID=2722755 RepID=UPI001431BF15|nr:hypothetical protein [Thalassospira sp. HF15]NIY77027.1 hypothetical protein [Thalassospira sp. HF15]